MIGGLIDRAISVISPERGQARLIARQRLEVMRAGYEGARPERMLKEWRTQNRSADLELATDADTMRARARDLVRNNALAEGVILSLVRNVVGCGIYPQARTDNERFNKAAEEEFDSWQKRCDVTGRLSFYELQRLALTEVLEAGECLVHFVEIDDPSRSVPFSLELIEADRLITDTHYARLNSGNGNEIRRGVEIDRYGRPVAYHVWERNPDDLNTLRQIPRRIRAEDCVHLFKQKRIGQTRGVTLFAPLIMTLKFLGKYTENELVTSTIASMFGVVITTINGDAGGIDSTECPTTDSTPASTGEKFSSLAPGLVAGLMPGEDVKVIDPKRSQADAANWITFLQRLVGIGAGVSYERLTRDYSKTNYSSNRAGDLEDRREFRPWQELIISHLCERVWIRFLAFGVRNGLKNFPNDVAFLGNFKKYIAHVWQAPGWEWVDPVKEGVAASAAINSFQSTLARECAKKGEDWQDNVLQGLKEIKFIYDQAISMGMPESLVTKAVDRAFGGNGELIKLAIAEMQVEAQAEQQSEQKESANVEPAEAA